MTFLGPQLPAIVLMTAMRTAMPNVTCGRITRGDIQKSLWGVEMVKEMLGNDEAELAQYSPANFADRIKAKVMLVVGGQDERVPPAHADKMRAALVKHGNAPEWLYYRSEGHGIHNEDTRLEMLTKVVGFLDANIGAAKN